MLRGLSEELVYEYTHTSHTKYRNHMLHEWMCTEANNHSATDTTTLDSDSDSDSDVDHIDTTPRLKTAPAIPDLPTGCISRLMRKVELPNGVSHHYPRRPPTTTTPIPTSHANANADYAIVFGTDQGVDSSSTPCLSPDEDAGIRRYACVPLEGEVRGADVDDPLGWGVVPPTLESYAFVPRAERHRFSDSMDDNCQIT